MISSSQSSDTLFMKDLDSQTTHKQVALFFAPYGEVEVERSKRIGEGKKITAFVRFANEKLAFEAKTKLQYGKIRNSKVILMLDCEKFQKRLDGRISVHKIKPETTCQELHELFSLISPNLYVYINEQTRKSKFHDGYVQYFNQSDAQLALEKEEWILKGQKLEVTLHPKFGANSNEKFQTDIYIHNIPQEIALDQIHQLLAKFGEIKKTKLGIRNSSQKFAHVYFEDTESAQNCFNHLLYHPETLDQKYDNLEVSWYPNKEEKQYLNWKREDSYSLFVNHLKSDITSEQLIEFFENYGLVVRVVILPSKSLLECQHSFVEFRKKEGMEKAFEEAKSHLDFPNLFAFGLNPIMKVKYNE